ncbi:MAG: hypothetical protein FWG15_02850 [Propionibacteriaceae bacterium]|nr:hypothetical protein [Propionibacteriaceae bacterium]
MNVPFAGRPLPECRPGGFSWPLPTLKWWETVSTMPHCCLWSDSDWCFAEHTARLVALFDEGASRLATEIRNRERVLGTTVEFRRDIRIRYVDEAPVVESENVVSLESYRDL